MAKMHTFALLAVLAGVRLKNLEWLLQFDVIFPQALAEEWGCRLAFIHFHVPTNQENFKIWAQH